MRWVLAEPPPVSDTAEPTPHAFWACLVPADTSIWFPPVSPGIELWVTGLQSSFTTHGGVAAHGGSLRTAESLPMVGGDSLLMGEGRSLPTVEITAHEGVTAHSGITHCL